MYTNLCRNNNTNPTFFGGTAIRQISLIHFTHILMLTAFVKLNYSTLLPKSNMNKLIMFFF